MLFLTFFSFGYAPYITKGTRVRVYTRIPLTTEHLEIGSIIYFIAPSDVWILENKAIAKGDIFKCYVDTLKMPIQGVNAAMKVTVTDIIKQDGMWNGSTIAPTFMKIVF